MFEEIGRRLRAHRLESGRSADELAEALAVSRAQVYRIEAGEIIKIETLVRLSSILNTSITALLGGSLEYYCRATDYFERMKQLEDESDQIIAHFPTISYLLSSDNYPAYLYKMLVEASNGRIDDDISEEVGLIINILNERKAAQKQRHLSVVNFVSVPEIEKLLQLGLVGRLDLPEAEIKLRRHAARGEVYHLLRLIENEPMGVQIALIDETLPNMNFQIFKGQGRTMLGLSPFRLGGELPNIKLGVASITADAEPIRMYQDIADDLWRRSRRGSEASAALRMILARSSHLTGEESYVASRLVP
jgi:transcriptional regulator with XRE-family HTH domain